MFDLSQIYKILPLKFLNFLKLTHLYRRIRGVCRAKLDYLSSLELYYLTFITCYKLCLILI